MTIWNTSLPAWKPPSGNNSSDLFPDAFEQSCVAMQLDNSMVSMILKFFEEQTLKCRSNCEVENKLLVNKLS